jgi:hypothetical protein
MADRATQPPTMMEDPPRHEEPLTREDLLRAKLTMLINRALNSMIEAGRIETGMMQLIANATATLAALDARVKSKETD